MVVSTNYRLGTFGFLNVPQLKTRANASEDSGNFALLDNIKALQFAQDNIANFGGDAGNVTLMGQSAGAIDVYAFADLAADGQRQPRAVPPGDVPLSGGISLASNLPPGSIPTLNTASVALLQGNALLHNLLIADRLASDTASAIAYVATQSSTQSRLPAREGSPATLLATLLTRLSPLGLAGSGPIPDGMVLPIDPVAVINAGDYVKVPVLASNTRDEAKLFPTFLTFLGAVGRRCAGVSASMGGGPKSDAG